MTPTETDLVIPTPSERQLAWHRMSFYGFIHFTTNTFTGKEWGYGDESPQIFNPTELDAGQWARVARDAGMKGLILTCKHHDGFCLWPSAYTEHSVKNSPWRAGKGDVVRELSDACHKYGLKFGVYLSPWDRNHPEYGKPAYITYYRNQLRELLSNYGSIYEVWLDGANGGDGYYGGANETRRVDLSCYYQWSETLKIVRELQPQAVVFSDGGPDVRWVGNESGLACETNWCTLNADGRYPGYFPEGYNHKADLGKGHEDGTHWLPAEVDVSIRPGWFYHASEDREVRSALNLLELYLNSVGRGANLLLNLPPDQRGLIHEVDVQNLMDFARMRDSLFAHPARKLSNSKVTTDIAINKGIISLESASPFACNMVCLSEDIACGQRVKEWTLQLCVDGAWTAVLSGTTIGPQRIIPFPMTCCSGARLVITQSLAPAVIADITLYKTPVIAREPAFVRDNQGLVTITTDTGVVTRITIDGSDVTPDAPIYNGPINMKNGGTLKAAVFAEDNPDALMAGTCFVEKHYGIPKQKWSIHSCSSEKSTTGEGASNLLDNNDNTCWATDSEVKGTPHFVAVNLGQTVTIRAFGYLPRQEGNWGMVNRGKFSVSNDGNNWESLTEEISFDNIGANPIQQYVPLEQPVCARYFKFTALGTVDQSTNASVAGLEVFA